MMASSTSWTAVIQTVVSALAVFIASIALFNTMRQTKEQREYLQRTHKESQSRSVDLWVESDVTGEVVNAPDAFFRTVSIQISNSSPSPIRDVIFELRTVSQVRNNEKRLETNVANVVPPTPIGDYFRWQYEMSVTRDIWVQQKYGTPESFEIAITFSDSNAKRWRRYTDGRIEELASSSS
jgi:hypothetical protein